MHQLKPFALLAAAALVACADSATEPRVAELELETPAAVTLDIGFTHEVRVVLRDGSGQAMSGERSSIVWSSTDSAVVQVDSMGIVFAAAHGRATIRARLGEVTTSVVVTVPPLVFRSVSPGGGMSCGVTQGDRAYCWGENEDGALGNGSLEWDSVPTPVVGEHRFGSISAYSSHACGLTPENRAYCWGKNSAGRLGNGSLEQSVFATPQEVAGGLVFASVHVGAWFTCALTPERQAYCWGDNDMGSLGNGTFTDRAEPTAAATPVAFSQLHLGSLHACALTVTGEAYCWGANASGQLGDGSTTDRPEPTPVAGGLTFRSIGAGNGRTCGVTTEGVGYCWGSNSWGSLGDGTEVDRLTPTAVVGGLSFTHIQPGTLDTCGLTVEGAAYCWGYNLTNGLGQPRDELHHSLVPVAVSGGLRFVELDRKHSHTCAKTSSGIWYCWGTNVFGQLGIGSLTIGSPEPVPIWGQGPG